VTSSEVISAGMFAGPCKTLFLFFPPPFFKLQQQRPSRIGFVADRRDTNISLCPELYQSSFRRDDHYPGLLLGGRTEEVTYAFTKWKSNSVKTTHCYGIGFTVSNCSEYGPSHGNATAAALTLRLGQKCLFMEIASTNHGRYSLIPEGE